MLTVNNYTITSEDLYRPLGIITEAGCCSGWYQDRAVELMNIEASDEDFFFADIFICETDGKQYAVCGNGDVTSPDTQFWFLELDDDDYVKSDKYIDLFTDVAYCNIQEYKEDYSAYNTAEECELTYEEIQDCNESLRNVELDFRPHDIIATDYVTVDGTDEFELFYRVSDDVRIAAYLAGARYEVYICGYTFYLN